MLTPQLFDRKRGDRLYYLSMENLREMPYLSMPQLQVGIFALVKLYYENEKYNSFALETAQALAFTDNLNEYLNYCKELNEQRQILINAPISF